MTETSEWRTRAGKPCSLEIHSSKRLRTRPVALVRDNSVSSWGRAGPGGMDLSLLGHDPRRSGRSRLEEVEAVPHTATGDIMTTLFRQIATWRASGREAFSVPSV